jgi:hypothetical protein
MATKFGVILIPSLLWLAWRQRARGLLLPLVAGFIFLALQDFMFNGDSVRAIWQGFTRDNAGGFEHAKWQNLITWSGVLVRTLGLPVFIFAIIGLARIRRRAAASPEIAPTPDKAAAMIAFLPFALHALGLFAINTAFPRHILPLIPPLLIAAAAGIARLPRGRTAAAIACLAWSALLAWSDGRTFRADPRERVFASLPEGQAPVWADAFFKIPLDRIRAERPSQAQAIILTEAWTWRFERSEINPLRPPGERELYHTDANDLAWYHRFREAEARGGWKEIARAGPVLILPEQFLYDTAWGSFEKFAGRCTAYARITPR